MITMLVRIRTLNKRCDIGNKEGFVKTNIEFALKDPDIADEMKAYITHLSQTF